MSGMPLTNQADGFIRLNVNKICPSSPNTQPCSAASRHLRKLRQVEGTAAWEDALRKCPPGARLIPLSHGLFAIVDECDYNHLSKFTWHASRKGYARRHTGGRLTPRKVFTMHREIMKCPEHLQVDHINQNKQDNRRCNLRLATSAQNQQNRPKLSNNTTGFKGVTFNKRSSKFVATIKVNGQQMHIGRYTTAIEAYEAYKAESLHLHGGFSVFASA